MKTFEKYIQNIFLETTNKIIHIKITLRVLKIDTFRVCDFRLRLLSKD